MYIEYINKSLLVLSLRLLKATKIAIIYTQTNYFYLRLTLLLVLCIKINIQEFSFSKRTDWTVF